MNHEEALSVLEDMHEVVQENLCYGICEICALWTKEGVCRASIINKAITEVQKQLRQEMGQANNG